MKRVVSVWFPAWPIARLARTSRAAVPKDKPFALVTSGVHGLTISAVNSVAAREGVHIGTALADARAALPSLISKPADLDADRIGLLKLARWAGRYGPNRHADGDDGLWIDITGVAHLFGGEESLLDELTRRLAASGVPACAGLADTLGAAHGLARFACPEGSAWALASAGETRAAMAPLPVEALRLDGACVLLLKRLGLRHIGQLYGIPRDSLARRFRSKEAASAVVLRLDQALGDANEPRRPMQQPPVLSVMRTFAEPLISSEALEAVVAELCAELSSALAAKDFGAKAVALALYRTDGTAAEIDVAMSTPSRDGAHIQMLLKEKLTNIDAGFGIDLVRLDALRIERRSIRQDTFATTSAIVDAGPLIDRLSNRLGAAAVTLLRPHASHIPERAEVRVPALKALRYEPPWPYRAGPYEREALDARRPAFLLKRPERIEVLAGVPDGPPARFTWRRVERLVARAEGPERIAPEWWRHVALQDGQKRPRPRDYYTIEDHQGAAYWVFRHGLYGAEDDEADEGDEASKPPRWFLHGLFA
ncbi:MAG: DNA polymerase Y family protein [Hyphomicrobium sp.]